MRRGETIRSGVLGSREGAREAEGLNHQGANCVVYPLSCHHFDQTARNCEPGVVVAPDGTRRSELRKLALRLGKVRQRVNAAIVGCELSLPPRRVG